VRKSLFSGKHERLRQLLIEARKAAGLTQEELGKKLSGHQQFVSRYETGERRLDVIEFLEVANVLGVDPAEVLRRVEDTEPLTPSDA
jgi:transcriptional regulator with XRE-family HTH domain